MNVSQKPHTVDLGGAINPLWAEFDLIARRKRKAAYSRPSLLDDRNQLLAAAKAVVARTASLWG